MSNLIKMPLDKIINHSLQKGTCKKCLSSLIHKRWWYLWGLVTYINKECNNSKKYF